MPFVNSSSGPVASARAHVALSPYPTSNAALSSSTMATHATQAIVCHPPVDGERQWYLEDIQVSDPRENEVLVELVASGVCHTDLGCGTNPDGTPGFPVPPYPRVLGHEGTVTLSRSLIDN